MHVDVVLHRVAHSAIREPRGRISGESDAATHRHPGRRPAPTGSARVHRPATGVVGGVGGTGHAAAIRRSSTALWVPASVRSEPTMYAQETKKIISVWGPIVLVIQHPISRGKNL